MAKEVKRKVGGRGAGIGTSLYTAKDGKVALFGKIVGVTRGAKGAKSFVLDNGKTITSTEGYLVGRAAALKAVGI